MTHFDDLLSDLRFIEAHENEVERAERERELRRHDPEFTEIIEGAEFTKGKP